MNEPPYRTSPSHTALSRLAWLYLHLAGKTARINITGNYSHTEPVIYAIWHRQQAMMIYLHRDKNLCCLVSKSKDGEYMARILKFFGFDCVRGSSSHGGLLAMRGLLRAAAKGHSAVITPDGPRGPVFKMHPGVIFLAQKSGVPIIPAACALSKKKIIRSWDKYQFPLPFSRVEAVYGAPFRVSAADDAAAKALELEAILNRLTIKAEGALERRGGD